jgi:hypothetical protein
VEFGIRTNSGEGARNANKRFKVVSSGQGLTLLLVRFSAVGPQLRSLLAKDVPIVVQAGGCGAGIDSLLGMSLLSRFTINIDAKTVRISPRTARADVDRAVAAELSNVFRPAPEAMLQSYAAPFLCLEKHFPRNPGF